MSTNLIEECTRRVCEREAAEYGMEVTAADLSRNRLYVAAVVADVLDLLSAEGRIASAIEPGLCWATAGITWPSGFEPRCELRAGHAGAHECDRGSMGGTATWLDADDTTISAPTHARPEAALGADAEEVEAS